MQLKFAACAANAGEVFADRANAYIGRSHGLRLSAVGVSSSTRKALVPPIPTELTAARRGVVLRSNGSKLVLTKNGERENGMRGLGVRKCRLGGIAPRSS